MAPWLTDNARTTPPIFMNYFAFILVPTTGCWNIQSRQRNRRRQARRWSHLL